MKLKFKHQGFQAEAARNVVRAFQGQAFHNGLIYIKDQGKRKDDKGLFKGEVVQGFGNAPLSLQRNHIADNVRALQIEQGLKPIDSLEGEGIHLTVEMETGTGKTYTYIKTMYELNKHYGWSKFIVVVPSVAIREGVYKSFTIMADHFAGEYECP
ncbi:DEAD/DEAH box helicase family protein [Capnocytophaga canimorsus]|uniref:DEAD/DEAH box helicase family protein n=1 Tax=Capnocytophaga canimorsus TaxID=28188 RepID=UPI00384B4BA7